MKYTWLAGFMNYLKNIKDKKIWYVQGLLLNLNHGFPKEQSCITKSCISLNHANTVTHVGIDLHIQFFTPFSLKKNIKLKYYLFNLYSYFDLENLDPWRKDTNSTV